MDIKNILLDFSLTVKAATLIFISERGSAISSRKGNQVLFIAWQRVNKLLGRTNLRAFHKSPNRIHTELIFINP